MCTEQEPELHLHFFTKLWPFEIFRMKIMSALYFLYRREYFHETLYKYKPSSYNMQKKADMREHVYVSACVGAKNDWVSVCLCIHPSIRLSMGMYLNIYIWMMLSVTLSNVCVSIRPSVCQPVCMPMCKYICPTICSSVHPFICIRECLFQRVNVSACGQG